MAGLLFVSVFIIVMVCWSGQHVDGQGLCFCVYTNVGNLV